MRYSLILPFLLMHFVAAGQPSGCLLIQENTFKNNELTHERINTYDEKQQLVKTEQRFMNPKMISYTLWEAYSYDKNRNIIETTSYLNGQFNKSIFRKFNQQNDLVEEAIVTADNNEKQLTKLTSNNELTLFNDDGTFTKIISENNLNGQLARKNTFNRDGKLTNSITYTYDERGEIASESAVEISRNRTTITVFNRNEAGAILEEVTTVNSAPFRKVVNAVDIAGKTVEKKVYNGLNQLDYTMNYTFDVYGNVTSETYFSNQKPITKIENTYDQFGNLTLTRTFDRGKLVSTTIREHKCF